MAYDHVKAAVIHRERYVVEDVLRERHEDEWRRTGLEGLGLAEIIERFKERAVAYEDADGSDETEHLYQELDDAKSELQRRPGDQRRALFALYTHADIRVRQAAADATRKLAPLLSRHRKLNIDDDNWVPPAEGVDIEQAGLESIFPTRTRKPGRLTALSVEQLVRQFVDLALQQDRAELGGEIAKLNRLLFKMWAVEGELKRRPGDERCALVSLYGHPNAQVRLQAATATLAVAPDAGRKALQELADSKNYPQ